MSRCDECGQDECATWCNSKAELLGKDHELNQHLEPPVWVEAEPNPITQRIRQVIKDSSWYIALVDADSAEWLESRQVTFKPLAGNKYQVELKESPWVYSGGRSAKFVARLYSKTFGFLNLDFYPDTDINPGQVIEVNNLTVELNSIT